MRITDHPILRDNEEKNWIKVTIDDKSYQAIDGEMIAATLLAHGLKIHRHTDKLGEPRGIYCGIGQCTDCVMEVDGVLNIRTCVTPIKDGMNIKTQKGMRTYGK